MTTHDLRQRHTLDCRCATSLAALLLAAALVLLHSARVEEDDKRRPSRRGLYIRLAIYVPLIAYFGYGALTRYRSEQPTAGATAPTTHGPKADPFEGLEAKEMVLPDGRVMPVYEVTPEQAEALGLTAPDPQVGDAPLPAPPAEGTAVVAGETSSAPATGPSNAGNGAAADGAEPNVADTQGPGIASTDPNAAKKASASP